MYGLFALDGAVNEDIEVVAAFGGNSDKLLIAAVIVNQCCVSLWGKGWRFFFFLHNYVAVVGRIICGRLCGCSLRIGRDRKTAHKDKGGTKGSHGLFQFILHLYFPPVLRSLPFR